MADSSVPHPSGMWLGYRESSGQRSMILPWESELILAILFVCLENDYHEGPVGTRQALEVFPPSLSSLSLISASPAVPSQTLTLMGHLEGVLLLRPVPE